VRDADECAAEAVDRLTVEPLGGLTLAEQRPGAGEEPQRPVAAVGLGDLRQPFERADGTLRLPAAGGRLDEIGQQPHRRTEPARVTGGPLGGDQRVVVPAEAVVANRVAPVGRHEPEALAVRITPRRPASTSARASVS
jgi:hypothetical protein